METSVEAVSTEVSTESNQEEQSQETVITPEQFKELQDQLDIIKKAQQGSDRKVSELEKEKAALLKERQEQEKAKMSADERLEYEKQLFEKEKQDFENQLKTSQAENLKKDYMLENKIDPRLSEFIKGNTLEEIEASAQKLLDGIRETADSLVKEKYKSTKTPTKGDTDNKGKTMTRAEFDALPIMEQGTVFKNGYTITD